MGSLQLSNGLTTGIGSLPHRDGHDAARFALASMALPAIPTLPRRSPAEGMIAQAVVGIEGITLGQYGSLAVDVKRINPIHPVRTDIQHDAFVGFRDFLEEAAAGKAGAVKWQLVGPVTLGIALVRAGIPEHAAFEVAVRAVRSHVQALLDIVDDALPGCSQVVFIDEPSLGRLAEPGFPLAPDTAIDLVSGALAAIEPRAVSGLHCCADADWASLIAAGPQILAVPVKPAVAFSSGYLQQFLNRGGVIAWGVVPTDGPIPMSAERPWRQLTELWCQMVQRGCDQVQLRRQCIVTPECGLGLHAPSVAERVHGITAEVGRRVHDQATATRFVLGA
jgi:methionine synthase II (cobalamin-independent)